MFVLYIYICMYVCMCELYTCMMVEINLFLFIILIIHTWWY